MLKSIFKSPKTVLLLIIALTLMALYIDLPQFPLNISYKNFTFNKTIGTNRISLFDGKINRSTELKKGLDIAGGVSVLLKADMKDIPQNDRKEALNSLKDIIERRVNLLGISESNIQTSIYNDEYRVIVELAGVFDVTKALSTIGQVAQLEFKVEDVMMNTITGSSDPAQNVPVFKETGLTGAQLRKASIIFDTSNAVSAKQPQIQLQFNTEGTQKFKEITSQNIDKRLAIYLDKDIIVAPTVKTAINDGIAVITGQFTIEEAKSLVTQLNAGALPVPVEVLQQRTIGPTLGQDAVVKSMFAGIVGLFLVVFFMIAYYRKLGILASISLIIYAIFTLFLYKLIPVVLTLPGVAGFMLSIGMAVDANILIFERIKEELRLNKPFSVSIENGFGRSWDSIRDANVTTLLTAFILFNPFDWSILPTSGLVRGFALTLAIGILMSLFTGVFLTRNLVRIFYKK